jgi:hypothetical protein
MHGRTPRGSFRALGGFVRCDVRGLFRWRERAASQYRVFFVDAGTVAISNLQIQNADAQGGFGGSSLSGGGGGGGAGLGGGLFVNQNESSATAGASGGSPAGSGTSDATPVFNYNGSVNGSTTTGPVAGALPSGMPNLRHARTTRKSAGAPMHGGARASGG